MYDFTQLIMTALISGLIGIVAGIIITRQLNPQGKENKQLEDRLEKAEEQLREYRHQVTEHFSHTSALVNNLTESYKDIHEYLASSALKLGNLDISQPVIIADAKSNLAQLAAGQTIEPPKDYAPKDNATPGTLSEEYGLKDHHSEDDDKDEVAKAVNDA